MPTHRGYRYHYNQADRILRFIPRKVHTIASHVHRAICEEMGIPPNTETVSLIVRCYRPRSHSREIIILCMLEYMIPTFTEHGAWELNDPSDIMFSMYDVNTGLKQNDIVRLVLIDHIASTAYVRIWSYKLEKTSDSSTTANASQTIVMRRLNWNHT
ncbi:hypothetical protein SPFM10_00280 [Salmonella phage SPFM10]|nr:hypothetical protein SPFM10_00280 [Salmonella phage SPFM10]